MVKDGSSWWYTGPQIHILFSVLPSLVKIAICLLDLQNENTAKLDKINHAESKLWQNLTLGFDTIF